MKRIGILVAIFCCLSFNANSLHWRAVPSIVPAFAMVGFMCDAVATGFSYQNAHQVELWLGAASFSTATVAMLLATVFSCQPQTPLNVAKYASAVALLFNVIGLVSDSIGYGFDHSVSAAFWSAVIPWFFNALHFLMTRLTDEVPVLNSV